MDYPTIWRSQFVSIYRKLQAIGVGNVIPGGIIRMLNRHHLENNWSSYLQAANWICVESRRVTKVGNGSLDELDEMIALYNTYQRKAKRAVVQTVEPAVPAAPTPIVVLPEEDLSGPPQPETNASTTELRLQPHKHKRKMLHRKLLPVTPVARERAPQQPVTEAPRRIEIDLNDLLQRIAKLPADVMGRIDWRAVENPQLVGMIRSELEKLIPANGIASITGKCPLFVWAMAGRIAGYRHCTLICSNGRSSIRV